MPLQTQQVPEETAAPLSPSSARLSDTAEAIQTIPNTADAELLEAAENAEQKRRGVFRIYYSLSNAVVVLLAVILLAMVAVAADLLPTYLQTPIWLCWIATLALNMICTQGIKWNWLTRLDHAVYDTATKLLPATNEPRRLLPFVDSLRAHKSPDERRQLYPALIELLWNLPAADAALLLDEPRRDALRNALTGSYTLMANFKRQASDGHFDDATADLAVAIMKTLAGTGDKKSVKAFQKIIGAEAKTANDTVVRDAAREYLPVLTQKITEDDAIQKQFRRVLAEKIRDPQKLLSEYLDTLTPEIAKSSLAEYVRVQRRGAYFWYQCFCVTLLPFIMFLINQKTQLVFVNFLIGALIAIAVGFPVWGLALFGSEDGRFSLELARRTENDVPLLPVLMRAAQSHPSKQQADAIQKAVARLLPLLQPGDAALVPPAQRAYLRSWLNLPRRKSKKGGKGNNSQTLAILALNALAAIGDTKALPAAEAIARRTTHGNYHETDLHEAALRCVDALRMRRN